MTATLLEVDGWTLCRADREGIAEVMTWFPDAGSVDIWGGPAFRFPFTADSFAEDCQFDIMDAYCLRDPSGRLAAFGQSYERQGRGHLARLIANPSMRRQGAGKRLIEMIIDALAGQSNYDEYSLFVYRHNEAAYRCYRSLGFVVRDYPADAAMPDKCYFLTRSGATA